MEEFAYLIAEEIYNKEYILKAEQSILSDYIEKFAQNIISQDQLSFILNDFFAIDNSEVPSLVSLIISRLKTPKYYDEQQDDSKNIDLAQPTQQKTQAQSQALFTDRIQNSTITTTRTTSSSFNTTPQQSPISSPTQPTPQQNTPPKLDPYREAI